MGRPRPAGAEELREDRVARLDQALLVRIQCAALGRHQEARAEHGRVGARVEGGAHVGGVGQAAGHQHRVVRAERGTRALEQLEGGGLAAHVPACLDALGDHAVGARRARRQRLLDGAALVDPGTGGSSSRAAPEGDDGVGARGGIPVRATGEREQQVHGDRLPRGPLPRGVDRVVERVGREDADRPEPARAGDRRSELVAREPAAHARLHDRVLDAQSLEEAGHLRPPRRPLGARGGARPPPTGAASGRRGS